MERRGWTAGQWDSLSRRERVEILAYQHLQDERRARLLAQVKDKMPHEFGALAQVLIWLRDIE